jgi:hypothetical protein
MICAMFSSRNRRVQMKLFAASSSIFASNSFRNSSSLDWTSGLNRRVRFRTSHFHQFGYGPTIFQ